MVSQAKKIKAMYQSWKQLSRGEKRDTLVDLGALGGFTGVGLTLPVPLAPIAVATIAAFGLSDKTHLHKLNRLYKKNLGKLM